MKHPNRYRRRDNKRKSELKKQQCRQIPIEDQQRIAEERKREKLERYPEPPLYRYSYKEPIPRQPSCYRQTIWSIFG